VRAARSRGSAASVRCGGLHNAQNATCAAACALALGVSTETLQNGLRSFPGLAHRMEQVGRRGHVLFVNDSKGTNADAAAHALSSFANIFWIADGKPKLGGITGLTEYFPCIEGRHVSERDFAHGGAGLTELRNWLT
jgi:UDP-N-acetylmuramoylalanine-D-glutamate ligase